jgi:hypothetical protein
MALVYVFGNLFNVLMENSWILELASSFYVVPYVVLVEDTKTSQFIQTHSWKREEYFDSFFRCFWLFFSDTISKLCKK